MVRFVVIFNWYLFALYLNYIQSGLNEILFAQSTQREIYISLRIDLMQHTHNNKHHNTIKLVLRASGWRSFWVAAIHSACYTARNVVDNIVARKYIERRQKILLYTNGIKDDFQCFLSSPLTIVDN